MSGPGLSAQGVPGALEPKRLVMLKGSHFDPYLGQFETASRAAIDWVKSHL